MSEIKTKSESKIYVTKEELKQKILSRLMAKGINDITKPPICELYDVVVQILKEIMFENRVRFKKRIKASSAKKVCYLCMEFLVGKSLKNDSINLGIYSDLCDIFADLGYCFDAICEYEQDPGLGNGGLGRLAACFMDSLSSLDYAAEGYSLLYENGLFKQRIVDGEQVELPDEWLESGYSRLYSPEGNSFIVRFGGKIEETWDNDGLKIRNYEYDEVRAIPYDLFIPGVDTNSVNIIRLWKAQDVKHDNLNSSLNIRHNGNSWLYSNITKQLYPADDFDQGKLLRLSQQYFLVSASLQSIISDYFLDYGTLDGFENKVSIHINDTHPALAIPELMRIFMDLYSYSWDDAWAIVVKCVSYTNHTVLPEALEQWRVDLFSVKLPRIFMIINEINRRFTADLWKLYPGDWDRISRMSIIAYNQIRMANLSIVGSCSVNGVSKLHSSILKESLFSDFFKITPWKFSNITNGVAHRRWLASANPRLSQFIDLVTDGDFRKNSNLLFNLMKYKDDLSVIDKIGQIKTDNKLDFAEYIFKKSGRVIDPRSIYDVQIKRVHEYKRQLLNVLKIIYLYIKLHDNPNFDFVPTTFIFGCKAAPSYIFAKKIIKLICHLSDELENDPIVRDRLKILFVEDYNVTVAESLIPSADISEQISLAGKEASGTGCMKLMMNGAITLGTFDGANIEIIDACGKENAYVFGMTAKEAENLQRSGYSPISYYQASYKLREVIDRLYKPIGKQDFSFIADYLIKSNHSPADPYMCLADFEGYVNEFEKIMNDYSQNTSWARKSFINTATSGIFSSDISVKNYADNIWHIKPISSFNEHF